MEYKFQSIFELNDKIEYIKSNQNKIIQLLNVCFDMGFRELHDLGFLLNSNYDLFICTIDDKLVGISLCGIDKNVFELEPKNIKTYDSVRYICTREAIKDTENDKNINIMETTLNPVLSSICKDMNYKNVGTFLLSNIEKYYKQQGYTKIYTVSESNKFRNELLDAHQSFDNKELSMKNLKNILQKYLETQNKLIKYYNNNGYVIDNKYYEAEIMPHNIEHLDPFIMFYNVMVKEL